MFHKVDFLANNYLFFSCALYGKPMREVCPIKTLKQMERTRTQKS